MADTTPTRFMELADEDGAGEFTLPHLDASASPDPDDERERYDEQILAALVSP